MERLKQFFTSRRFLGVVAALAVIAAVSLAFFYPDALEGKVLQQPDMQQGIANSREISDYKAQTGETSWWTNSLLGGMPTFQISPSYPATHLFSWLTTIYGLFLPSPANLLAMMMIGMLILLLAMRVRTSMALIGAVAWGLSSYFVIIIGAGHIWKFVTLAYVPPVIAGLVMIYHGRRLLGAGVAALFMMLQIASNHVQMSYYFSWVMLGFVIAYGVEARRAGKLRAWGTGTAIFAAAMLLAVAANAPSLYHTYKYSKETIRGGHSELTQPASKAGNTTGGLDRDYITQYSYEKMETFSLLIPNIKGGSSAESLADSPKGQKLIEENPSLRGNSQTFGLSGLPQYFGGEEGTSGPVYVGAIIVALALLGAIVVRGPLKWALVALTLLSVFLAWGRHMQWFTDLFIDWVPMYSKFRTVESILVIAEFTLPLLAILGLREFFAAKDKKAMLKPLYISFGVCIFFCLLGAAAPTLFGSNGIWPREQQYIDNLIEMQNQGYDVSPYMAVFDAARSARMGLLSADALRSLLFLLVGGAALWFAARKPAVKPAAVIALLGAAVLTDLYTADKRYLSTDDFHTPRPEAPITPSAADLAIMQDTGPDYRVLDLARFGSAEPSYFHKTVGGYHAAKLTRYQDLIDRHLTDPQQPGFFNVVNMLNTRYIITDPNAEPMLNDEALGNAWFVSSLDYVDGADAEINALSDIDPATMAVADSEFRSVLGTPAPASPADAIRLTSYAPDRLEYSATTAGGALAVFSEIYFPWGWTVTIDGTPAELGRVDYVMRALPVPAGTHTIVMEFRPRSVAVSNSVACAAVGIVYLLLLGGIIMAMRRKK